MTANERRPAEIPDPAKGAEAAEHATAHRPSASRPPGRGYGYRPRPAATQSRDDATARPDASPDRTSPEPMLVASPQPVATDPGAAYAQSSIPPPDVVREIAHAGEPGERRSRFARVALLTTAGIGLVIAASVFTAFMDREPVNQAAPPARPDETPPTSSPITAETARPSTPAPAPGPQPARPAGAPDATNGAPTSDEREREPVTTAPVRDSVSAKAREQAVPAPAPQAEREPAELPSPPAQRAPRISTASDKAAGPVAATPSRSVTTPRTTTATRAPELILRPAIAPGPTRPGRGEACSPAAIALALCEVKSAD